MAIIEYNKSLKGFNTFQIDAQATAFVQVKSEEDARTIIDHHLTAYSRFIILGGGSNLLFTNDYDGLVIHVAFQGIEIVEEKTEACLIKAGAGEDWSDFVDYCAEKGWGGIENLARIPGQVGATPVQNIGAYGREVKEVIDSVEAIDLQTAEKRTFSNAECRFGYRDSVFKHELKDRYLITSVIFRLSKNTDFLLDYGSIRDVLREMEPEEITYKTVADTVKHIRTSKLPDVSKLGSAGSFFKNPVLSAEDFEYMKAENPDMPFFKTEEGYKIPAGWLIEQCGWKGYREENYGVYSRQALVLVNYGGASGKGIADLAWRIREDVQDLFGIRLQPEVTVI